MGVPSFVVAEVNLHEVHAEVHEVARHKQRPAETVVAVAFNLFGISFGKIKGIVRLAVGQQRKGGLAVFIKVFLIGSGL